MSEDKSQEQNAPEEDRGGRMEYLPAPSPDAAHYVMQPTRYIIHERVMGEMPEDRHTEEVLRGGEEEAGDTFSVDAHPPENQPAPGLDPDHELPQNDGRDALRDELQERYRK